MAAFNKFNQFVADLANKVHNLGSDSLKIYLSNTAPSATNAIKTDIAEIATGNGYSGPVGLTVTASTQSGGTYKLVANDLSPMVTASGSVGPFRYAILYNDTSTSPVDPLIGWWDYGSSITMASGETFTWAALPWPALFTFLAMALLSCRTCWLKIALRRLVMRWVRV